MELIAELFPEISSRQKEQFDALDGLYREWNQKINLISRKDIDHLYQHHVLHSLALAKYNPFKEAMRVLDVGTGGGFPGIPLAIMYPDVKFDLLDSTAKKINVVNDIAQSLQLENVTGIHSRAEAHLGEYDLIIGRAVSTLDQMVTWTSHLTTKNRWIILKGGNQKDIRKELPPVFRISFKAINDFFPGDYFIEKWIVDVQKT
ncbi:MAG TPA: 16S rRNA (guanine(527)-N(7))-methyltransferase RsmG [Saprospiraceae bacterium]|nr:16S rRNA (guanine(527)-N(7))-methyltransferase RsmG [Saprospiraceae bacterium]